MSAQARTSVTEDLPFEIQEISYHALVRRLQLEDATPEQIAFVASDPDARKIAEAIMKREMVSGFSLSPKGKGVLQHPGHEETFLVGSKVKRFRRGDVYRWFGRVCYVIEDGMARTVIHVTDEQHASLENRENVLVASSMEWILDQVFGQDGSSSNDRPPISSPRAERDVQIPCWMCLSGSSVTIAVVDEWDNTPLKELIGQLGTKSAETPFPAVFVAPDVSKRIVGLVRKRIAPRIVEIPPVPRADEETETSVQAFPFNVDAWWESVHSGLNGESGHLLLVLKPKEALSFLTVALGSTRANGFEWRLIPGCVVSIQWAQQWTSWNGIKVSWEQC